MVAKGWVGAGWLEEMDGGEVQTSSYKINKFWGCNVQQYCIVYLKVAKRLDLSVLTTGKKGNYVR